MVISEKVALWRKAVAQFLAGILTWATAVVVSDSARITAAEWVVLLGGLIGAFLVWLVPNEPSAADDDAGQSTPLVNALMITVLVIVIILLLRGHL